MPVETPGQKTTRDRPFSTAIEGMTSTRLGRARRQALAAERPAVEADREGSATQEGVVETAERERRSKPALFLLAEPEQQHLPQQVREVVRRRVGIAAGFGERGRALGAGLRDQELRRLLDPELAAGHAEVVHEPRRAPERVRRH